MGSTANAEPGQIQVLKTFFQNSNRCSELIPAAQECYYPSIGTSAPSASPMMRQKMQGSGIEIGHSHRQSNKLKSVARILLKGPMKPGRAGGVSTKHECREIQICRITSGAVAPL
jgi:hypothetical protein